MVRKKYFERIKLYYLNKIEEISKLPERDYKNYYDFVDLVNSFTNTFNNNSESTNYILNYALNSNKFEEYEKSNIMKHLIEVVKDWELFEDWEFNFKVMKSIFREILDLVTFIVIFSLLFFDFI